MGWPPTQIVSAVAGALQVVGILVVVAEVWRLRQLFDVDSAPFAKRAWHWQGWPRRHGRVVQLGPVEITSTTDMVGSLVTHVDRQGDTPEERLTRLEQRFWAHEDQHVELQRQADQRHAVLVRRHDDTDARISCDRREQRKTTEEATSAGRPMHVWGVLALLTGLLLSISPDAIVTAWQWETWWFRSGTIAALAIGSTFVKGT